MNSGSSNSSASNFPSIKHTSPPTSQSSVFVTLTGKRKSSPSRAKRGGFGSHISGFVVTISSLRKIPPRRSLSCATIKSFQPVSASGAVNVNETFPSASVSKSGKKNAVSFRFLRGAASEVASAALPLADCNNTITFRSSASSSAHSAASAHSTTHSSSAMAIAGMGAAAILHTSPPKDSPNPPRSRMPIWRP